LAVGAVVAGETERRIFEALSLECPEAKEREIVDGKPMWLRAFRQIRFSTTR